METIKTLFVTIGIFTSIMLMTTVSHAETKPAKDNPEITRAEEMAKMKAEIKAEMEADAKVKAEAEELAKEDARRKLEGSPEVLGMKTTIAGLQHYMRDPDSFKMREVKIYKHIDAKTNQEFFAICGVYDGKNQFGGYTQTPFYSLV